VYIGHLEGNSYVQVSYTSNVTLKWYLCLLIHCSLSFKSLLLWVETLCYKIWSWQHVIIFPQTLFRFQSHNDDPLQWSGVSVEKPSGLHQCWELAFREGRPQTLDNKLRAVLEDMACQKRHFSLESLRSLVKAVADIPQEMECAARAEWPEHLKVCVRAYGSHFEWHYYKWEPKTIANKLFCLKSGCFV
jgi:hypothetical protein